MGTDAHSARRLGRALLTTVTVGAWLATAAPSAAHAASGTIGAAGFGDATVTGSPVPTDGAERGTGIATDPHGDGYWISTDTGGVFAYGDASFEGSLGGTRLNQPIVGIAPTTSGDGYWLVARDGGVFAFGDARFHGSTGAIALNQPIVGIAPTSTGHGYWLVARDGGVFAFGDARFVGSAAGTTFQPAVGIAATPTGAGYWIATRDGGVFAYGDATFAGSAAGHVGDAVGIVATPTGGGYWIAGRDGGVFAFGDAHFAGSAAGTTFQPAAGIAATPTGAGYRLLLSPSGTVPTTRALAAPAVPAGSGSGRRVVYSNSAQRLWLVESDDVVYDSYRISGRRGIPSPGTYSVWVRMRHGRSGDLDLPYFVGFAHGRSTSIGFHGIPLRPNGSPIESDAQLGQPLSHGCVRENQADAAEMWDWAPLGTTVVVLP